MKNRILTQQFRIPYSKPVQNSGEIAGPFQAIWMQFRAALQAPGESVDTLIMQSEQQDSLKVKVRHIKSGILFELQGELDIVTVGAVEDQYIQAKEEAAADENQKYILDFTKLSFIDSAGLALLIRISREFKTAERGLTVIVAPRSQSERVLKLGQFDKILNITHDLKSL